MFLTNGFWYAVEFSSFKNAFYHLYQYLKWYYENRDDLGYGVSIRILVAFLTPHFLYKLFLSTNWKSFLKKKIVQILKLIITRRKKGNESSNSSKPNGSSYGYSNKNNYSSSRHYGNNNGHHARDAERKVNMIKQLLIKDIEETIDKRLHDIFFGERSKSH
jgi:hypothetical protein